MTSRLVLISCSRRSKWDNPVPNSPSATETAREAARKLNAMLAAKGKLNTNTVPPLRVSELITEKNVCQDVK